MTIRNPVTSSTAAITIGCGESCVRYYADRGRIRFHRMPSGLRLYEQADVERVARERAEQRQRRAQGIASEVLRRG